MNMSQLALLLDTLGTIMIAFAALRVHHRVLNEHKIDAHVFTIMKREQLLGVSGIVLVTVSFVLQFFLIA